MSLVINDSLVLKSDKMRDVVVYYVTQEFTRHLFLTTFFVF